MIRREGRSWGIHMNPKLTDGDGLEGGDVMGREWEI